MEASSINQPHPDDVEDFFGDGNETVDEPAAVAVPAANATEDFDAEPPYDPASVTTEPDPVVTEPEPVATEPEPVATETEPPPTEPDPDGGTPPVVEDAPVPEAQAPPAPLDPAVDPPEPAPEEGAKTEPRPYLVFQEIVLTERMLKSLLDEYKNSSDPEPRKVYYVMATEMQRTAIGALEAAYTANKETLGDEATLVTLTEKSWKPKHIKPKVKTKVSLDIS